MKKSIKIAIYSGVIPATTFIEHLIKEVANHHQVYVFGTKKAPIKYASKSIHIVETPTNQWRNILWTLGRVLRLAVKNPKNIYRAYKEAKRYTRPYEQWMRFCRFIPVLLYEPEVFHLQWASKIDRWMFLKEAYDCKIILSLLGSNICIDPLTNPKLAATYRAHFPKVDTFHAVSQDLAKQAMTYGAPADRIEVVRTTLPEQLFKPLKKRSRKTDTLHMVSVGRHHWVKGYKDAIEAVGLLKAQGICVSYTIIAQGVVPDELRFLTQQCDVQNHVIFKSGLAQAQLFQTLQQCDVLLLPSLSEGIANVVLEAMALGVPVISTDVGGMPEVVRPGQTGWLVPPANPKAFSEAIRTFLQTDEALIEAIIQQAFQLVQTEFQTEKIAKQYIALYENSLKFKPSV